MTWSQRCLILVIMLLPFAALVSYVIKLAHGMPFFDDWGYVNVFQSYVDDGKLPWKEIFHQHRLHWLPVIKMGVLAACQWAGGDLRVLCAVTLGLAMITVFALWWCWRSDQVYGVWGSVVGAAAIALSSFSWAHAQAWLWGTLFVIWLPPLALMVGLNIFRREEWSWWAALVALLLSLLSIASYGSGVLVWLCLLIDAWWRTGRRWPWAHWSQREKLWWLFWSGLHLALILTRIMAGVFGEQGKAGSEIKIDLSLWLVFLARITGAHLGASSAEPLHFSTAVGLVVWFVALAMFGWLLLKARVEDRKRAALSVAVAAFGAGSALLVAYGRYTPGLMMAMETRYGVGTLFLPLGVILVALTVRWNRRGEKILMAGLGAWLVLTSLGWIWGWQQGVVWSGQRWQNEAAVHFSPIADDEVVDESFPGQAARLRQIVSWMNQRKMASFKTLVTSRRLSEIGYKIATKPMSQNLAALESIEELTQSTQLRGFAWAPGRARPADLIIATLADDHGVEQIVSITRPFAEKEWRRTRACGLENDHIVVRWQLTLPKKAEYMPADKQRLQLYVVDQKKKILHHIRHQEVWFSEGSVITQRTELEVQ